MIAKTDWQAVQEQLAEDDRQRLGDPPTAEEMLAYSRGELSSADEDRVRAALVADPDLARALTEPFPDHATLPDAELERRWSSMQERIGRGRVLRFPRAWTAIAAALALVFAGLYWQAETKARRLSHELSLPRAAGESNLLYPAAQRGAGDGAVTVTASGEVILLEIPLINAPPHETYRLEIVSGGRAVWTSGALRPGTNESFVVLVPRSFLKPGRYEVVVHGGGEKLETYAMRVE
jgi:hypothetical protein